MSYRVLVIEDSVTLRTLLELSLKQHLSAQVRTAENGLKALEVIDSEAEPFDIILLDVNMPVMDGFEFLDKRREHPKALSIPTVIMTTEAAKEDRDIAVSLGANGFLRKPFQGRDIIAVVKGILGDRPAK